MWFMQSHSNTLMYFFVKLSDSVTSQASDVIDGFSKANTSTNQDGDSEYKLVGGTDSTSEADRCYLGQVHGAETSVEAVVDADNEAAGNQHLVGASHFAEPEEDRGDESEGVVDEQPALTAEPVGGGEGGGVSTCRRR